MVSKNGLNISDTIGKLIFQEIAKAENDAFISYSSPLQRRSLSNIEFLENFHCVL